MKMATHGCPPCIVCGCEIEHVDGPNPRNGMTSCVNQPHAGTAFTSPGHYGSTAWDPMDGSHLEFNICDPCLRQAGKDGRVLVGRRSRPVKVDAPNDAYGPSICGYENIPRADVVWDGKALSYDRNDSLTISIEEALAMVEAGTAEERPTGIEPNVYFHLSITSWVKYLREKGQMK